MADDKKHPDSSKQHELVVRSNPIDGIEEGETSQEGTLQQDLKAIIESFTRGPLLAPLSPGQSRKVTYLGGEMAIEMNIPSQDPSSSSAGPVDQSPHQRRPVVVTDVSESSEYVRATSSESTETPGLRRMPNKLDFSENFSSRTENEKEQETQNPSILNFGHTERILTKLCNTCEQKMPTGGCQQDRPAFHSPRIENEKGEGTRNPSILNFDHKERILTKLCNTCENKMPTGGRQQDQPPAFNRYNYNHVAYPGPKRKIRWTNYIPSLPKMPSMPRLQNILRKNRKESDFSEGSGVTVPQLYKAKVASGPSPQRFTFRAVSGAVDSRMGLFASSSSSKRRTPSNELKPPSETFIYNVTPHYPGLQQSSPFLRSNPATFRDAQPSQDFCSQCIENSGVYSNWLDSKRKKEDINPEKARAFLGEKGEGYISVDTIPERVDVYCFDQLNTGFFRTSDHPPPLVADVAIESTEAISTRIWAEIFGFLHVVLAFFTAAILQGFKFMLLAVVRPLMIGLVQLLSDYFIKPFLTVIYNGFTQPISIFLYNVFASIRDIMNPIGKALGYFFEMFATLLKSIRLVEIKHIHYPYPPGQPQFP